MLLPSELIKKKRAGLAHTAAEIFFLVRGYTKGEIPDYQMSAWLMAVCFSGMTAEETAVLTQAMLDSGRKLDFSRLEHVAVDKHSTGGVGDKTSLILAPIVAAAGVPVPMISGRGLGHTGGTLDKLESIPGFNTSLSIEIFSKQVIEIGLALAGQTSEICPADKKIYALRDVTGTVESLPLICASIMSKKLAEGIGALVLDVKFGSGAFMKTFAQAEDLTNRLMAIGKAHGKRVSALITNMEQPLGRFIGNSLEVGECLAILKGESYLGRNDFDDCVELSLALSGQMIWLGGRADSPEHGLSLAQDLLKSGRAYQVFKRVCQAQGGDIDGLPLARGRYDVLASSLLGAKKSGYIESYDTEKIGLAAIALGAGRKKSSDAVDPTAGFEMHFKLGDEVKHGDRLFTIYKDFASNQTNGADVIADVSAALLAATTISLQKPPVAALIAAQKASDWHG